MKILLVTPEFDPDGKKGYQIIANQFLDFYHSVGATVHVVSVTRKRKINCAPPPYLKHEIRVDPIKSLFYVILSIFTLMPLQVSLYRSSKLQIIVDSLIRDNCYKFICVNTLRCGYIYNSHLKSCGLINHVDDMVKGYLNLAKQARLVTQFLYRFESQAISSYLSKISGNFRLHGYVSSVDAKNNHTRYSTIKVPYGLSLDKFPEPLASNSSHRLVFTGNLSYPPNEMALVWFIDSVFPLIKDKVSDVELLVVGTAPSSKLRSLILKSTSIYLHNDVFSVNEYLQTAMVSLAPITNDVGVQTKILEAFVAGIPVVATSAANAGIGAVDKSELLIANTAIDFAQCVIDLLCDRSLWLRLSINSRKFALANFDLKKQFVEFNQTLETALNI